MKVITKLFLAGAVLGAGAWVTRRLLQRRRLEAIGEELGDLGDAVIEEVEIFGIASVDPQPMTQVAGEGIDLEADELAHRTT